MQEAKILVLGLGQVSIGYDLDRPNQGIKTHLFAIKNYLKINFLEAQIYAVDPDLHQRNKASLVFPDLKIFSNLNDISEREFDIVVVAVPIRQLSIETRRVISEFQFRYLIVEKPGVSTKKEALEFNSFSSLKQNIFLAYPRRTLTSTRFLKNLLAMHPNSQWKIEIHYSGSPKNILVHFLDLIETVLPDSFEIPDESNISIQVVNSAARNNNDHTVLFHGPQNFEYLQGGKIIIDGEGRVHNFEVELESQINYCAENYLDALFFEKELIFPSKISNLVMGVLEG